VLAHQCPALALQCPIAALHFRVLMAG